MENDDNHQANDLSPDNNKDYMNFFDSKSNHDDDSASLSPQAILARNSVSEMSNGPNNMTSGISMSPQQMFTPMAGSNNMGNVAGNNNSNNSPSVGAATPQQILMFNNSSQHNPSNQASPVIQNTDMNTLSHASENTGHTFADRAAMFASLQQQHQQQQHQQQQHRIHLRSLFLKHDHTPPRMPALMVLKTGSVFAKAEIRRRRANNNGNMITIVC